jgi:hypothetical protein
LFLLLLSKSIEMAALHRMLELSPAQLRQAADHATFGPPSARLSVDNTAQNTTSTQSLQEQIRSKLLHLHNEQWSSKLPFHGICPVSAPDCVEHDDILAFCDIKHMFKEQVFRFSSEVYPPTKAGLDQLVREIKLAAKVSGGMDLVSNGGTGSKATNLANLTTKP